MLKRLPMFALCGAMVLSACSQTPNVPRTTAAPLQVQQDQTEGEGANDASLDALIRELDAEAGDQAATPSTPVQALMFRTQQAEDRTRNRDRERDRDRSYGWYGGYGYGPYGYGIFARCQRIYRRCLNRAYYYYSGSNTYQFCRRVRNRCVRAQWIRS